MRASRLRWFLAVFCVCNVGLPCAKGNVGIWMGAGQQYMTVRGTSAGVAATFSTSCPHLTDVRIYVGGTVVNSKTRAPGQGPESYELTAY